MNGDAESAGNKCVPMTEDALNAMLDLVDCCAAPSIRAMSTEGVQVKHCSPATPTPPAVNGGPLSDVARWCEMAGKSGLLARMDRWSVDNTVDLIEPDHRPRYAAPFHEPASPTIGLLENPGTKDTPQGKACAALLACLDAHREPTGMRRTELLHYLLDELHTTVSDQDCPANYPAWRYTPFQLEDLFTHGVGDVPVTDATLLMTAMNAREAWQRVLIAMRRIGAQVQHRRVDWPGWEAIPFDEDLVKECCEMPLWDILNDAVRGAAIAQRFLMAMHESLTASQTQPEASK